LLKRTVSCASEYSDLFEPPTGVPNRLDTKGNPVTFRIRTKDNSTSYRTTYRLTQEESAELSRQLTLFLEKGWVHPSCSSFGAPVLFVPKKAIDPRTGRRALRMVIDYRPLNKITCKDRYPLPHIEDLINDLEGCLVFSKLEMDNGYTESLPAVMPLKRRHLL
jgi:hypothetical protein